MKITHQFLNKEYFFPNWKIHTLVLGTFNPICGETTDYFYGRSLNKFWRVIEEITGKKNKFTLNDFSRKHEIMVKYKFGCADIIKSVRISKYYKTMICEGYSDSSLFTRKHVELTYQFEEIKKYLIDNNIRKVINTWGRRVNPKNFYLNVLDLEKFCIKNNIDFIKSCPSPSRRSKSTLPILNRFYKREILNEILF